MVTILMGKHAKSVMLVVHNALQLVQTNVIDATGAISLMLPLMAP
jgi:TRAP-type C4-dicarboxylate transport system permease large subunit